MKVYELKKIIEEKFEDEFQNEVGKTQSKELFYTTVPIKSILFIFLLFIPPIFIIAKGNFPTVLKLLLPDNIFTLGVYIYIFYSLFIENKPTIILNIQDKIFEYNSKKVKFEDIISITIQKDNRMCLKYNADTIMINIQEIKNLKKLILILKKELNEKISFE